METDNVTSDISVEVMEEGCVTEKGEVKEKSSLVELLSEAVESQKGLLIHLSSSLLDCFLKDANFKNQKNQAMLNDLKAEVFIQTASIVKYSQKQEKAIEALKHKFLTTLYSISDNVMKFPDTDIVSFSSRVIENGVKRKKLEEEKQIFEREREVFAPFLRTSSATYKDVGKKKRKLEVECEVPNPMTKAKESLYEVVKFFSSHSSFKEIVKIKEFETLERFETFLSQLKTTKAKEWLLAVGFLMRSAKKRFDLFQEFKTKSLSYEEMTDGFEFYLAGEMGKIPSCLKIGGKK